MIETDSTFHLLEDSSTSWVGSAQPCSSPRKRLPTQAVWRESSTLPSCPKNSLGFMRVCPKGWKLMSWPSGKIERPKALCSRPGLDTDHLWDLGQAPCSLSGAQRLSLWMDGAKCSPKSSSSDLVAPWACFHAFPSSFSITCGVFPQPTFPTLTFLISQPACTEPSPVPGSVKWQGQKWTTWKHGASISCTRGQGMQKSGSVASFWWEACPHFLSASISAPSSRNL